MSFVTRIGRSAIEGWRGFAVRAEFIGETFAAAVAVSLRPRSLRFADAVRAFRRAATGGLAVTTGIGFLLGVILAFQSAAALSMFGVEVYVADFLAVGLFRELGPLVTAIVLAGRSGSAFAAEIGTMKVNEELDALATMGLSPVRFLVLPRILAAVAAMPVLTIFAELEGLAGGLPVLALMGVPPEVYWRHAADATSVFAIVFGLGKSALFGLLVGLVGCSAGMRTRMTADGVGQAATAAVVGSMVAIAVADGLAAWLCYIWGL
jgi:phospholipid/cholesterol/gamma-HCH transport system permease protein